MPVTRKAIVGFALGLALAAHGPASFAQNSQAPAGGAGVLNRQGGVNAVMVLMAPAVQEELKLTEEQKTQVFDVAREASQKSRELMQSAFRSGGGNPQALMAAGLRLRQENEKAAVRILKPEQKGRANEIMLRVEGPLAVARPEIAAKLNLSETQNQQVQATMTQMVMAARGMAQGGNDAGGNTDDPNGGRSSMAQLREAAGQQIGRVLSAKQKAAFNKMLGEPFDLSKIDPTFPRSGASDSPSGKEKASPRRKRGTPAAKDKGVGATGEAKPKG